MSQPIDCYRQQQQRWATQQEPKDDEDVSSNDDLEVVNSGEHTGHFSPSGHPIVALHIPNLKHLVK